MPGTRPLHDFTMYSKSHIEIDPGRQASVLADPDIGVIFFDGLCNLCNGWVRFVLKRDVSAAFRFAPLQSDFASEVLQETQHDGLDSIVLLTDGKIFFKSTAVLRIVRRLRLPWPLLWILMVIPRAIRDFVYDIVAHNRYRWFGRREECMIPSPEIRERFLG